MPGARRCFLGLFAATLLACSAHASILWGVTNGTGDAGFWTGGQIFTVDTGSGATSVLASYNSTTLKAFGDVAVRQNGEVYVTYYGNDGFDKLAKVNTSTWGFDWVQDIGGWNDQINALTFINDNLYGVTGGGIPANLIRFSLTGSGATATNLGSLGTNSDGDIAVHPTTGVTYYTSWATGSTSELNTISLAPPSILSSKEISTSSGWAGIDFTLDGTMWAGTYWDQKLYTLDYATANAYHTATQVYDLSSPLGGTITGLSMRPIPEPSTLLLLGGGLAGLFAWYRRRGVRA